jgi:hypothetical protein
MEFRNSCGGFMIKTSLATAVKMAIQSYMTGIHTALPAQIEKYDYATQKADVKPLIKKKYKDGTISEMPVITNVPVIWPRSASASLTFPLNRGDGVLLVFSERSIDTWLSKGGQSEPGDPRKFDLSDAVAIPGLYPFTQGGYAENNTDALLIYKSSKIRIKGSGEIEIESSADFKINASGKVDISGSGAVDIDGSSVKIAGGTLAVMLDSIITKFNTHGHATAAVGPPSPPIPIPPAVLPVTFTSADSTTKTKVG